MAWQLRPCVDGDAHWIAELRADVMRPDLERLGRFDPERVRRRFLAGFDASSTHVIEVATKPVGCIAVRRTPDAHRLEHFYLDATLQGQGIGTAVLSHVLAEHGPSATFRLNVLSGSPAQRLYARHSFTIEREDPIDVYMVRAPRP
ncbi:GNAT family N-acetyltransferase [Nocardioides gilvus]|uniref:GNAT family N-acetyltransferase n=1 Tax=Nocardioides gilvus TaxID=1735589 RepID=UPI000D7497D3|nr:GNAT family N-acetyltransferase [Nocardioides gilvus]